MLDRNAAIMFVRKRLPGFTIQKVVEYDNRYIFLTTDPDPDEGMYDGFYSVDKFTHEFSDFSIITDGDIVVIDSLFEAARKEP